MHHALHMTAGHIVRFEIVACHVGQSGLVRFYQTRHNDIGRHITDAHQKQLDERNVNARYLGRQPEEERHEVKEYTQNDDDRYRNDNRSEKLNFHGYR